MTRCNVSPAPERRSSTSSRTGATTTDAAKRDILALYRSDIRKVGGTQAYKILSVFDTIPGELSKHEKKFALADVAAGARMRDLEAAFTWLAESMTVNMAYATTEPNVGFSLHADRSSLKCYLADTGLLVSMAIDEKRLSAGEVWWRTSTRGAAGASCGAAPGGADSAGRVGERGGGDSARKEREGGAEGDLYCDFSLRDLIRRRRPAGICLRRCRRIRRDIQIVRTETTNQTSSLRRHSPPLKTRTRRWRETCPPGAGLSPNLLGIWG